MIPILYEKNTTSFTTNGIGRLNDLIDCTVTEERNGEFILIATLPMSSRMYSEVKKDRIIFASAHDGDSGQPFRIQKISRPFNEQIEIEAVHISYQLCWIPLRTFTAANCADVMSQIPQKSITTNPFTFWTDIQTVANFKLETPSSIRSILGGVEGSVLDIYGGEYEFDGYTVKLHSARGVDSGVTLRYGKNITDIEQEDSIENTYTGIVPYWQDENTLVTVDGYVVNSEYSTLYSFNRVKVVDFSSDFDEAPTKAQLLARAQSYIASNNVGVPTVSIDVSFVALWQTEEYKNIAPLERVHLCDYVTVYFEKLGIAAKAKVVKTEYDVLMERYKEITLGTISASLAVTINDIDKSIKQSQVETKSAMQKAIDNATAQITGSKGGVIQTHYNADEEPYELVIINNKDLSQATKVWRWNIGGLGYSKDGYDGPYTTAITQDGSIVADFITTGTLDASKATITNINASNINTGALNASLITTGTLDASKATITNINASNIKTGTLNGTLVTVTNLNASNIIAGTIKNKNDNNTYWNLNTGAFKTTNATIVNGTCTGSFYSESGGTWVELKNGMFHGSKSGYTEIGAVTFNFTINSGGNHYDAMSIQAFKDLHIQGHLWVDPDGGGAYRVLDNSSIEIVNWIQWRTQRSSGVEWVKEGTEMACGRATFHCGMLCEWTQFENVIVGE